MDGLYAHHTGDDILGIRRSSTNCAIRNCYAHNCSFGHCIQAASSTVFGQVASAPNRRIEISGCNVHDAEDLGREEGGITFHSATDSIIKGNRVKAVGSGIMVLGESAGDQMDARGKVTVTGSGLHTSIIGEETEFLFNVKHAGPGNIV